MQTLSEKEKAVVLGCGLSAVQAGPNELLDTLIGFAQEKRNMCEERRWKFEFRGRSCELRNEADRVISWLNAFKQIGDVAVNVDPLHAGLPWAGIRFLLQVGFVLPIRAIKSTDPIATGSRFRERTDGGDPRWPRQGPLHCQTLQRV